MPKKSVSNYEVEIANELSQLGYSIYIDFEYFTVYRVNEKNIKVKFFSIEKDTYFLTIHQAFYISLDVAKIMVRLLEHYKKKKLKELFK